MTGTERDDGLTALSAVRVVAGREIRVKLRDKAFLATTAFLLLLVAVATVVPVLLSQQVPALRVAVQGTAAEQAVELAAGLGRQAQEEDEEVPPVTALLEPAGLPAADIEMVVLEPEADPERLVLDEDVAAAVVGDDLDALRVLGREGVPPEVDVLVAAASAQLQVAEAAQEAGLSREDVVALIDPTPPEVTVLDARPTGAVPPELLVLVFAFLFYVSVLTFGMSIAQSVVEEKQSRVVELLVAALPVRWLLAGKVVGNTVMAVGQIVVIVAAGLVGAMLMGRGQLVGQVLAASGWFVVFFLLGFVMLACLWAAAGALASRVEDLNATTVVMQVLVVVPFFTAIFAIDPGPVQRILSYVPFTAPLLMPARIVLGNADPWEPFVAALVVLATGVAFVALGVRLYRNAVLHTASRLHARQAWRGVGR
ncbi:sodium ABC transporter permease [Actinotalea ferrariae CF5-4]|uniref:Sodium ABC transporter permease n=1 Tax=Actinotalea ferrariae CF5-4 TaxID=948458 RepID=A0A021VSV5_9CELL|nr:ABC transporter permease [Actinotalea ferrariae]EYR62152.1 sodium ABC transporter permease [Actinotalea ferrariae CF5-4]